MKFSLCFLLASLAVANAYLPKALQDKWGYLDSKEFAEKNPKVVGGENAKDGEFPYAVSLQMNQFIIGWSHICGGSIIAPNFILTAAHCCDAGSTFRILYGSLLRTGGIAITVIRIIKHDSWNTNTIDYDYCILQLSVSIQPGINAQVVVLAEKQHEDGEGCSVIGWGNTRGGQNSLATTLQVGRKECLDRQKCNDIWGSTNAVTPRMCCTFHSAKSACNGDSGGPMVNSKGEQVGVVSWGGSGCPVAVPSVYANVPNQLAWIKQQIGSK